MIETESKSFNRILSSPIAEILMIPLGFGAFVLLVYGKLLTAWWGWDDPQFVKLAYQYAPWEYFFIPEVWSKAQPANLNPWNILSFDVDVNLFGLNSIGYYAHHLFSLWLVGLATYFFLRLWLNQLWSAMGGLLFLCSAPAATVAHQLMNRHYLEGLLFSIVALYLYVSAVRYERIFLSCLGALFYLFAVSAKEVFVPLALVLPLIPERDLRRRLTSALPFLFVLSFYAFWRRYMLGRWIGGYTPSIDWTSVYPVILKAPSFIFGDGLVGVGILLMIIALLLYAGWRNPSARALIVGAFLLLLAPVLPVIHISDPQRLLFLFVWALSMAVALTLGTMARSSGALRLTAALVAGVIIGISMACEGWKTRSVVEAASDGFESHGRFIMNADKGEALLPSIEFQNWFATGLLWLRKNVLHEEAPQVVFDEIDLASLDRDFYRFFRYDAARRSLEDVTGLVPHIYEQWKGRLKDRPLSVSIDYIGGMLSWQLGPHKNGEYYILMYGESGYKLQLPPSGAMRIFITEPIVFRVRYDAPEGWTTYSPLLQFDGKELTVRKIDPQESYR